ncbi:MAG: FGGY family carbohydrate kinase [Ignavibacteriales bacterium]|nr:FGGY family carbohydrate kinase [Ignavibacteriales bacterium]
MKTGSRKDLVIGLDCSTTAAKAIAFDRKGNVVARTHEAIPLSSPQPQYYEQDPNDWWISTQKVLRQISRQINPAKISAIAISNQRETFVPLDKYGDYLRPAIVWLDERCKSEVNSFSEKIGKGRILRITGKPPDYAPVVYRLAWMKKHEPKLFGNIGMICDVHSYIVWKLTNAFKTSWASADPFGLFDLNHKRWSPIILKALELEEGQFPGAYRPGTILGRVSNEASALTGLSTETAVVAGGGDGQAAGLGSNVLTSARAYLNLGTAVVAGVYGKQYRTSKAFRTMSSCSESGYYYECSLRAGTFAVDWFIKEVLKIDPLQQSDIYRQLEQEAQQVPPGSDGLLHLPYLCGVMNPYWDMNARGAFVGLSSFHHRGHFYRSILEGIAFEQLLAINAVERIIGTKVRDFVAIGGGATNNLWCHILADVTGRNICLPENTEASALGAAIAAAVGMGWCWTFKEAARKMTGVRKTIRPEKKNQREYQRLYFEYKRIYPRLKSTREVNKA